MDVGRIDSNATATYEMSRQPGWNENFTFLYRRTLLVGLHVVTNSDANETAIRLADDVEWVDACVDEHRDGIEAVFVMGYGRLRAPENRPLYDALVHRKRSGWAEPLVVYARWASASGLARDVGGVGDLV